MKNTVKKVAVVLAMALAALWVPSILYVAIHPEHTGMHGPFCMSIFITSIAAGAAFGFACFMLTYHWDKW